MDFKNCKRCGKLFRNIGRDVCPSCMRLDEEQFQTVKSYLVKNKTAGIQEVVEETGVPHDDIIRYLKEERLELKGEGGEMFLVCESCGDPISTGRFCKKCLKRLQSDISGIAPKEEETKSTKNSEVKFRIIDRYNNK